MKQLTHGLQDTKYRSMFTASIQLLRADRTFLYVEASLLSALLFFRFYPTFECEHDDLKLMGRQYQSEARSRVCRGSWYNCRVFLCRNTKDEPGYYAENSYTR